MTMAAAKNTDPLWYATAERADTRGSDMLDITQVSHLTGLTAATIQVALYSEANTGRRARLRHLARPQWNYKGIPMWSAEQVASYHSTVHARWNVRKEFADLPVVTDEAEVVKNQLGSLRALSRISTVPLTTLHRWKLADTFPSPVALMQVESPTPRVLYSWPELRSCIENHHQDWLDAHPQVDLDKRRITDATM